MSEPKFNHGDSVRIRDDDKVGVVISLGVAMGEGAAETLEVDCGSGDVRTVFADACDAAGEGATLRAAAASDTKITPSRDTVAAAEDDHLTLDDFHEIDRPHDGAEVN